MSTVQQETGFEEGAPCNEKADTATKDFWKGAGQKAPFRDKQLIACPKGFMHLGNLISYQLITFGFLAYWLISQTLSLTNCCLTGRML